MPSNINLYKTRFLQSFILLTVGFLGFSIADLCSKILQDHYRIYQVLTVSGFIGMSVTGVWLYAQHGLKSFFPKNLKQHLIRAVIVMMTAFSMVSALRTLPFADFYGVVFTAPFILLILSVLFLKERVGWRRWLAVCVAFAGVIVLAGPQFSTMGMGFVFAAMGALCVALNIISLRKIGHGAPMALYAFYPSLFITVFNSAGMLLTDSYIPFEWEYIKEFSIHGPAALLGTICCALGYARAPEASAAAPFVYTQIIWGVLFGWVFFHAVPDNTTIVGLVMIIAAGCYSIWRDYLHGHNHAVMPD
jgi:drug/metabolite transporter (DMT)-like permease